MKLLLNLLSMAQDELAARKALGLPPTALHKGRTLSQLLGIIDWLERRILALERGASHEMPSLGF